MCGFLLLGPVRSRTLRCGKRRDHDTNDRCLPTQSQLRAPASRVFSARHRNFRFDRRTRFWALTRTPRTHLRFTTQKVLRRIVFFHSWSRHFPLAALDDRTSDVPVAIPDLRPRLIRGSSREPPRLFLRTIREDHALSQSETPSIDESFFASS